MRGTLARRFVVSAWLLAAAASCSRAPEEPSPATRPTADPSSKPLPSETAKSTAMPSNPTPPCPPDDDPGAVGRLFGRGEAVFVTPEGTRHTFQVEVASTDEAQQRGLMFRTSLAEDRGMVFAFEAAHQATFWMHNTCIPLDMVFVGENRKVIGVVTAPPLNDQGRGVPGQSKWVVELAAGVAKKRGIAIGTSFEPPK